MGETVSRERLLALSAELGISSVALEEAERSYLANKEDENLRARFDHHRRSKFWNSVAGSVGTMVICCAVDLITTHWITWAYWVVLPCLWSIASSAWETFGQRGEDYEKAFLKWQVKKGLLPEGSVVFDENDDDEEHERGKRVDLTVKVGTR